MVEVAEPSQTIQKGISTVTIMICNINRSLVIEPSSPLDLPSPGKPFRSVDVVNRGAERSVRQQGALGAGALLMQHQNQPS